MFLILIGRLIIFSVSFLIFLILLEKKIEILERKIIQIFKKRTNLIPSLFEIGKKYIEKEDEVFKEIIYLKKIEFYNVLNNVSFIDFIENEKKIHYEIEFLFKVFNKKQKLQKNAKFLYIKELILEDTSKIGNYISLYKKIISKYNKLVVFKNLTIIGIFLPIYKKTSI